MAKFMDVHSGFIGVTAQNCRRRTARPRHRGRRRRALRARLARPGAGQGLLPRHRSPSQEAVMRIHERAGHPTAEVYELSVEVA